MTDAITGTTAAPSQASTSSIYTGTTGGGTPKQSMDGEMFLKLLITQLKNQDPSNPMDSSQMIEQTAQLAQMEQLTAMSTTSTEAFGLQMRATASNLVGKQVSYVDADGKDATGVASAVSFKSAVPQVTVNGVQIALDAISGVTN